VALPFGDHFNRDVVISIGYTRRKAKYRPQLSNFS